MDTNRLSVFQDEPISVEALQGEIAAFVRSKVGDGLPITVTVVIGKLHPLDTLPLRHVEECIFRAAPSSVESPVSTKRLSRAAGYGCSSYFRDAVASLVDRGFLVRVTGGIRKAK